MKTCGGLRSKCVKHLTVVDLTFWPTMCLHWSHLKCGSEVTSASMKLLSNNKGWHRQYPRLPWHHLCTKTVTGSDETHSITILRHCYHTHPPPNPPLVFYLNVSWSAMRVKKPRGLDFFIPPSATDPPSPLLRVSSNSMVINTRPEWSTPPPPTFSTILTRVGWCRRCSGWAFATAWRMGWSSRPASPPQPLPVSYFLSLRDSCFFFSDVPAFTLEGSAGAAGACGGGGRGGLGRTGEESHFRRKGACVREREKEREMGVLDMRWRWA